MDDAIEEESDDEDSFEMAAPVKKSKTQQAKKPSKAAPSADEKTKSTPTPDAFLDEFQQA